MEYFNLNAFILGSLLFACSYISNIAYCLLCLFYRIKINKFTIFYNPWFSLYKESIMGTKYLLGWLPLGCSINPLGMSATEEEKLQFKETELSFAFFTKPKYLRTIFNIVPWFIYLLAFIISLVLLSGPLNFLTEFNMIMKYIISAFETMYGSDYLRVQFINQTQDIIANTDIVVFVFNLLTLFLFLSSPLPWLMNWISDEKKTKSIIQKILGFILSACICWFMVWKIPKFIFSFFSFHQIFTYILSILLGMFSFGIISFFSTLFVVKNVSLNINNRELK